MTKYQVLRIDAWGNADEGWDWNQWFPAGTIDIDINADDDVILQAMHDDGWLRTADCSIVQVQDDGYNLIIESVNTGEPLFAIEYGSK